MYWLLCDIYGSGSSCFLNFYMIVYLVMYFRVLINLFKGISFLLWEKFEEENM